MSLQDRISRLFRRGSNPSTSGPGVHSPPHWSADCDPGFYVSYYRERENGEWHAFYLRVEGELEEGGYLVTADVKQPEADLCLTFQFHPDGTDDEIDLLLLGAEALRGTPASHEEPAGHYAFLINVFQVQRLAIASRVFDREPTAVELPCGVTEAYPVEEEVKLFRYVLTHLVHPRVPITGVIRTASSGDRMVLTATSFGSLVPRPDCVPPYDDYVDTEHRKRIDHVDFALTYPATWILRHATRESGGAQEKCWLVHVGGNYHAMHMTVTIWTGAKPGARPLAEIEEERREHARTLSAPDWTIDLKEQGPLSFSQGLGERFLHHSRHDAVDGLKLTALYRSREDERLAELVCFCCYQRDNPRRREIESLKGFYDGIAGSFEFGAVESKN